MSLPVPILHSPSVLEFPTASVGALRVAVMPHLDVGKESPHVDCVSTLRANRVVAAVHVVPRNVYWIDLRATVAANMLVT